MQAGKEKKKKKENKGKIVIKVFDNMNRSFMITNFMIVGIWWILFKNYFAGKPLREASQILGKLRLLGKSKQSYKALAQCYAFGGERTVEKGPPSLPSGFFSSLISSTGDICGLERTLSHTLCQRREWRPFTFHATFAAHWESRGAASERTGAAGRGCASPALMQVGQEWPLPSPLLCLPAEGTEAQGLGSPRPPQDTPKGAIQAQPGFSLQLHVRVLVVPASSSIFGFPLRRAGSAVPTKLLHSWSWWTTRRDRLAAGRRTLATLALGGSALPAELKFQLRWLLACWVCKHPHILLRLKVG